MHAVDSSSLLAFLKGDEGTDTELIANEMARSRIAISPVVVVECLSRQETRHFIEPQLRQLYVLTQDEEYWFRASLLRARALAKGRKARTADTLIAQSCIDHDVPLITRDQDFRVFAQVGGLRLAKSVSG